MFKANNVWMLGNTKLGKEAEFFFKSLTIVHSLAGKNFHCNWSVGTAVDCAKDTGVTATTDKDPPLVVVVEASGRL
jgi:hypothetical protein